ncbi:MAG: helix-turn-helix domain-containing protein [bacterium]
MNELPLQGEDHEITIELLTLNEVAEICRVSTATVRYWLSMRKLRSLKLGKHPLVKREELLRFVRAAEAAGANDQPAYLN